jgi:hypothetical protein
VAGAFLAFTTAGSLLVGSGVVLWPISVGLNPCLTLSGAAVLVFVTWDVLSAAINVMTGRLEHFASLVWWTDRVSFVATLVTFPAAIAYGLHAWKLTAPPAAYLASGAVFFLLVCSASGMFAGMLLGEAESRYTAWREALALWESEGDWELVGDDEAGWEFVEDDGETK